jgi:hypothetical protein
MGRMDLTPHVGMFNRVKNLEEAIFTNVGISVSFIRNLSFQSDPTHMWHKFLFKQLPNTQRMGLPFPTHMQNRNKKNN